jgi:hypothetical protein
MICFQAHKGHEYEVYLVFCPEGMKNKGRDDLALCNTTAKD